MKAFALVVFVPVLLVASWSPALALVVQLGDQDFPNGTITALFDPVSVGEPPPFDGFRGDDNAIDFSENWTFNFAPGLYTSGSITIGIFDHDSASPGSQLAAFGFDGNDLTAALDLLFESSGGAQLEVNVYTVALPPATLADLGHLHAHAQGDYAERPWPRASQQRCGAGLRSARSRRGGASPRAVSPVVPAGRAHHPGGDAPRPFQT